VEVFVVIHLILQLLSFEYIIKLKYQRFNLIFINFLFLWSYVYIILQIFTI